MADIRKSSISLKILIYIKGEGEQRGGRKFRKGELRKLFIYIFYQMKKKKKILSEFKNRKYYLLGDVKDENFLCATELRSYK